MSKMLSNIILIIAIGVFLFSGYKLYQIFSEYNKGDTVVFPSTDGLDFNFDDGQFLILKIDSLIGKIQN